MALGAGTLAALVGLGLAGLHGGYPAVRPHLGSGDAWLPSDRVGQLTLLDGSTAEVAGQVQVAAAGDRVDAVQVGSTAYAVDRTTGAIRRVDGATFQAGTPSVLIQDATGGLVAFAAADTLYAVDTDRGVLARADARTLAGSGPPLPLSAQLTPQSVALDGAGRLWLLDTATGDLSRFDGGGRQVHAHAAAPGGGLLAVAGGAPVVVDTKGGTATVLDPGSGAARRSVPLNLRAGDGIQVSGSADGRRLYLVAGRGLLSICDLDRASCDTAVPLHADEFGAPVESGGRVFVPDYSTGEVWVVDVAGASVLARPSVLPGGTRFQLLSRDGVVFFNDPASARAGVIGLDGGVREVAKYSASAAPGSSSPSPVTSAGPTPTRTPTPTPTPTPRPTPTRTPTPTPTKQPPVRHAIRIGVSDATPAVGTDVTLGVVVDSGPPATGARWSLGDGTVDSALTVRHRWATAQTYQVSVQASFADGATVTASVPIRVHNPAVTLTVTVSGPGRVTGGGISCPSTCQVPVASGTAVTLTEAPGSGATFSGWGAPCGGTATRCTVTVTANTTVSAKFAASPPVLSRSGTLAPGATACVGPFFADGVVGSTHSVHFAGNVTGGSGASLHWTVRASATGATKLDRSGPNVTWDEVNFGSNPDFPGSFTGCATNETGAPVGYTEFIGKGPF